MFVCERPPRHKTAKIHNFLLLFGILALCGKPEGAFYFLDGVHPWIYFCCCDSMYINVFLNAKDLKEMGISQPVNVQRWCAHPPPKKPNPHGKEGAGHMSYKREFSK